MVFVMPHYLFNGIHIYLATWEFPAVCIHVQAIATDRQTDVTPHFIMEVGA